METECEAGKDASKQVKREQGPEMSDSETVSPATASEAPGSAPALPAEATALDEAVRASAPHARYAQAVDRESAYERLNAARGAKGPDEMRAAPKPKAGAEVRAEVRAESRPETESGPEEEPSVVEQVVGSGMFRSLARSVGTQIGREITRSLFGAARRRR
ncbi:hypothetical protein GCM10022232_22790 [Streptomyces plumbiresistens]|uniref:Helicase HerA-like C-terminal domain-containing protein n=1 Tax=Streptomyces plumbiresistens TaxID=511811 RepID=A0ABP7QX74_9ACTN